jgi:hypothetical protein
MRFSRFRRDLVHDAWVAFIVLGYLTLLNAGASAQEFTPQQRQFWSRHSVALLKGACAPGPLSCTRA